MLDGYRALRERFRLWRDFQEMKRRMAPWLKADGDRTLRLDYDLDADSLVLDVGGYEGQWASDIFAMYCCRVHVFEPVPDYAIGIKRRFSRNPRITVHAFGLAGETGRSMISVSSAGSSVFKKGSDMVEAEFVRASDFFERNGVGRADLMKVNIEGGEYDLVGHLVESGLIRRIRDLQVQFHSFVPDAEARMRRVQEGLAKTHRLTYQFPFVWENWRMKE